MSVSSTATGTTLYSIPSDFQPHRPPRSGLRITMPTDNSTRLSPESMETPSCELSHPSMTHGSSDGLLRTSESSDESFNESTESPAPQTPATPQEMQVGRLPTAATVPPPGSAEGVARPTAAHLRAKRKPVPSVIDLLGYDPGPMPSHPLTPGTPGTPGTPFTAGSSSGHRFTIGPLAGIDLPDLDQDSESRCSSGHARKYSGITLQNGNPSVLSLPMRVLEVDRPASESRRVVRRSTYNCYSTYTCDYNSSRPDLSLVRDPTEPKKDIIPPPRRQSISRSDGPRKLSAASELEELRRITHYASMDFDTIKRHNRINQSSFFMGDNDSDQSSISSNKDGPVTKRLKKLSMKKKSGPSYTKASATRMSAIAEKQPEQPKGWLEWMCDVVPCLRREKVSCILACCGL